MKKKKALTIFITENCRDKFQTIKAKISQLKGNQHKIIHMGNNFNLLELIKFQPDIIVEDYENEKIFVLEQDILKQQNPFV